jgi:glycyl-tRNA synthetase
LQRSRRIVPVDTAAGYDPAALREPAELRLHEVLTATLARLDAEASGWDLHRFTDAAGALTEPVHAFFDDVLVMADDPALRHARLGLLATVRDLGAGVLDWQQLTM